MRMQVGNSPVSANLHLYSADDRKTDHRQQTPIEEIIHANFFFRVFPQPSMPIIHTHPHSLFILLFSATPACAAVALNAKEMKKKRKLKKVGGREIIQILFLSHRKTMRDIIASFFLLSFVPFAASEGQKCRRAAVIRTRASLWRTFGVKSQEIQHQFSSNFRLMMLHRKWDDSRLLLLAAQIFFSWICYFLTWS